jgi:hypothetical protein
MPRPDEIQVLILLSLIPVVIAAMYSLTQVSEYIRNRGREKPRRSVHLPGSARQSLNRRR